MARATDKKPNGNENISERNEIITSDIEETEVGQKNKKTAMTTDELLEIFGEDVTGSCKMPFSTTKSANSSKSTRKKTSVEKKKIPSPSELHKGHRQRMRNRIENEGLDHLAEHELLEVILFEAYKRRNTNDIAHILLNTHGTVDNLLQKAYRYKPGDELPDGLTENTQKHLSKVQKEIYQEIYNLYSQCPIHMQSLYSLAICVLRRESDIFMVVICGKDGRIKQLDMCELEGVGAIDRIYGRVMECKQAHVPFHLACVGHTDLLQSLRKEPYYVSASTLMLSLDENWGPNWVEA